MTDLPKGKWCECGYPHETGGPCWECRASKLETDMTDRENDALRSTNIDQAAEIGILRTEKHADAEAIGSQAAEIERIRAALKIAEAALSDIGDAHREEGDDLAWCERRAAKAIPIVRAALAQEAQTDE